MQSRVVGWAPVPKAIPGLYRHGLQTSRRGLPGWAKPEAVDHNGTVEAMPGRVPARLDRADRRSRVHGPPERSRTSAGLPRQRRSPASSTVSSAESSSSKPLGEQLEHASPGCTPPRRVRPGSRCEPGRSSAEGCLQAVEEALVLVVARLIDLRVELLEQASALIVEPPRECARSRPRVGRRVRVPAVGACPVTVEHLDRAGLCAGVEVELELAIERRHASAHPQARLPPSRCRAA